MAVVVVVVEVLSVEMVHPQKVVMEEQVQHGL